MSEEVPSPPDEANLTALIAYAIRNQKPHTSNIIIQLQLCNRFLSYFPHRPS